MSARYSSSPALNLQIGRSRLRQLWLGLLYAVCALTLYLVYQRGYPGLALALLLPLAWCCISLPGRDQPVSGLHWRAGDWCLQRGEELIRVDILADTVCRPWGIYLAWVNLEDGERGSLWLFPDSAPTPALRRLRVCLALQRGVGRQQHGIPGDRQ